MQEWKRAHNPALTLAEDVLLTVPARAVRREGHRAVVDFFSSIAHRQPV
jgi:hypothetical protein